MEVSQSVASHVSPMTENLSSDVLAECAGSDTVTESCSKELAAPVASSGGLVYVLADGSNPGDENIHGQYMNSFSQDVLQYVAYESKPEIGAVRAVENVASHENSVGTLAHSVGYESVNGDASELGRYQCSGAIENGIPSNVAGAPTGAEQSFEDVNSAEELRLWSVVTANCLDFNAWTALIEETEKVYENNIMKIRKIYDAFLGEFPLCFGYWKKYADHEGRLDSCDKVVEVYERAVNAVTYSVDIWLHYCMFVISTYEDPDIIRRLFERGLAFVGSDYLSYPLWDEYIRYEEAHQSWIHLAMIYTRILENPIQQLDRYFNCIKELAASRRLSEIRTAEEASITTASMNTYAPCLEGEVRPEGVEQSHKPVSAGLTEAEELENY